MAKNSPVDSAQVVLAVGKEQVLVGRVIDTVMKSAREQDPNVVRVDISATGDAGTGELAMALAPSLFGELSVIIVNNLENASEDLTELITSSLDSLPDNIRLVLVHPGGVKGKKLLDAVRKTGAVEASCAELKGKGLTDAIVAEFARHGRKATSGAIDQLQASIGTDLGSLIAAVSQLCADTDEKMVDEHAVATYYDGVADVTGWKVSDAMWDAQPLEVLEMFRWAVTNDSSAAVPQVMAISSGLRTLLKYAAASSTMSEAQLASHVGVPDWKLKRLRQQKQKWNPEQLAAAARLLALADRASKGTVYEPAIPGGRSLDDIQKWYHIEKELMAIRPPK